MPRPTFSCATPVPSPRSLLSPTPSLFSPTHHQHSFEARPASPSSLQPSSRPRLLASVLCNIFRGPHWSPLSWPVGHRHTLCLVLTSSSTSTSNILSTLSSAAQHTTTPAGCFSPKTHPPYRTTRRNLLFNSLHARARPRCNSIYI